MRCCVSVLQVIDRHAVHLTHPIRGRIESRKEGSLLADAAGIAAVLFEARTGMETASRTHQLVRIRRATASVNRLTVKITEERPPAVVKTAFDPDVQQIEDRRAHEILSLIHHNDVEPVRTGFKGKLSVKRIDRVEQLRVVRLFFRCLKFTGDRRQDNNITEALVESSRRDIRASRGSRYFIRKPVAQKSVEADQQYTVSRTRTASCEFQREQSLASPRCALKQAAWVAAKKIEQVLLLFGQPQETPF